MIYTLTLNPAVDYTVRVNNLKQGQVNRTVSEQLAFGGKGINVSFVLKELGVNSKALGFAGGFTGVALEKYLLQKNILCDFVKIDGDTRINVKINSTDINAQGPTVTAGEIDRLYGKLDALQSGDILVLSGSVPMGVPKSIYAQIMHRLASRKIKFVLDAEKNLIETALKYKPFLIKPNQYELGEIFGVEISDFESALFYALKLKEKGAENVMVTLGEKGAVLVDLNGDCHKTNAPCGKVISAVGSGDSSVAAFLAAYQNGKNYCECLNFAVAAGSATAFSNGIATAESIHKIYKNMYS